MSEENHEHLEQQELNEVHPHRVGDDDEVEVSDEFIESVLKHAADRARKSDLSDDMEMSASEFVDHLCRSIVLETVHQMAQDGLLAQHQATTPDAADQERGDLHFKGGFLRLHPDSNGLPELHILVDDDLISKLAQWRPRNDEGGES